MAEGQEGDDQRKRITRSWFWNGVRYVPVCWPHATARRAAFQSTRTAKTRQKPWLANTWASAEPQRYRPISGAHRPNRPNRGAPVAQGAIRSFYTDERIELHRKGEDKDLYPNTNWYKELFRDFGLTQRANFNVSGGAEKATYYISGGYYGETGLIKPYKDESYDTKSYYRRYNFTANIGVNVTGTTKLDLGIATIVDKRNGPYDGAVTNVSNNLFEQALRVSPHIIPAKYSNGQWPGTPDGRSSPARFAFGFGSGYDYSATLRPNIKVKQDLSMIVKGLSLSGLFSFDVYTDATVATTRAARMYYAEGRDANGELITRQLNTSNDLLSYASARSTNRRMYSEASLNYQANFGRKHEVGGLLLFNQSEYIDGNATTFTTATPTRNRGLTGRATYGFNSRYFVEGNFGYTGSENFSPAKRYGFFPSFGVGWVVSNENFFEPVKDVLSYFKLRYSYGLTGNGGYSGSRFLYLDMLTKASCRCLSVWNTIGIIDQLWRLYGIAGCYRCYVGNFLPP